MNPGQFQSKADLFESVILALGEDRAISRGDLARQCKTSTTTIGKMITMLYEYGMLSIRHTRTKEKGRTSDLFSLSRTVAFGILRTNRESLRLDILDLCLQPLRFVHHKLRPDRDPQESLLLFLTECRRTTTEMRTQLLSTALLFHDGPDAAPPYAEWICEQLCAPLDLRTHLFDSILHTAISRGMIPVDANALLVDDRAEGLWLCSGNSVAIGAHTPTAAAAPALLGHLPLIRALPRLLAEHRPDTLLLCSRFPTPTLLQELEDALIHTATPRPASVIVADVEEMILHGTGLTLRRMWIERILRDSGAKPYTSPPRDGD